MLNYKRILSFSLWGLITMSCCLSIQAETDLVEAVDPAETLFVQGEYSLEKGDYQKAVKHFEQYQMQYPFSPDTEQVLRDMIYAYYKVNDKASALAIADRYVKLYPRSEHVDYGYYMRGLVNFEQERGFLVRYFPIRIAERDVGSMRQAYDDFLMLVNRFPNSVYTSDALQRLRYLRNLFAEHELSVAKTYMKRKAYVAAANRASYLIENYPQAPEVERALVILVKANREMGLDTPAEQALEVLQINYPGSTYLGELNDL